MKLLYLSAALTVLFTLRDCNRHSGKPVEMAKKFLKHMQRSDWESAKKIATPGTAARLDAMKNSTDAAKRSDVYILGAAIAEKQALINYRIGNDTAVKTIGMLRTGGKWLASLDTSEFERRPTTVALIFLHSFFHFDYLTAKSVSTAESKKQIAIFEEIMGAMGSDIAKAEAQKVRVYVGKERINGDQATVEYTLSNEPAVKTVRMIRAEGKWLAEWSKLDLVEADGNADLADTSTYEGK